MTSRSFLHFTICQSVGRFSLRRRSQRLSRRLRMAVWDIKTLWFFMFLLGGAVGYGVNYPDHVCAVKGSTVTLPCTFTPVQYEGIPVVVVRVRWCQNHLICQGGTPSVYDSDSTTSNPRYRYLGDKKGNCTLQIINVQREDEATLRFRIEANPKEATFTGTLGVNVTVSDITVTNSSRGDREMRRGEKITLHCTTLCHLDITWFKDGHALSGSDPALQLGPLTEKDSGNYTCGLKTDTRALSPPYSLQVEAEQEEQTEKDDDKEKGGGNLALTVGVVFGVLLVLFTLIMVLFIIRRRRAALGGAVEQKLPDNIYSNVLPPAEQQGGGQRQETSRAVDDVSYAAVQFRQKNQARPAKEAEDAIIYSSVVSRG